MKVAVVCRGQSLKALNTLQDDIDLYIIVNRFGDELQMPEVGPFLEGKNIFQILSRTPGEVEGMSSRGLYTKFNIQGIVQPYTIHMKNPKDFGDGNNKYYKFIDDKFFFCAEETPIQATWLGDHHIEHMDTYQKRYPHHYPSSGNAAVGYAVLDTGATEIELIGMDFYDVGYLADGGPGGPESGRHMKDSVIRFIKNFPNIQFTIHTCGNLNFTSNNLKIINIE